MMVGHKHQKHAGVLLSAKINLQLMRFIGTIFFLPIAIFLRVDFISPAMAQNNQHNQDFTQQSRDSASKALAEIMQTMRLTREKVADLAKQVDGLKKDQKTLTAEMIKAAQIERQAAQTIADSEEKLSQLLEKKTLVQNNLQLRRKEFAEVLAALERIGVNPPPAILMNPDDALTSVRSSVLLSSLVPQMREKTKALSDNLKELTKIGDLIKSEQDNMYAQVQQQAEQKQRLTLLISEKAKLQKSSESALDQQRQASIALAEKAKSLEDLITELERQAKQQELLGQNNNQKLNALLDFSKQKGQLLRPVAGKTVQYYGDNNGAAMGETIETLPTALVTSPLDAIVAYAGPFRSYGQLIILDVQKNSFILLAGMEKINVSQGQFVLSGEPLGTMGTQNIGTMAALDIGKTTPMLYIEFREQGKPVNPSPWWRVGQMGRKDNDA